MLEKQERAFYDHCKQRGAFDRFSAETVMLRVLIGLWDEPAASAAWRLSVETWLHQKGLIGLSQGAQVLPGFL